MLWPDSGVGRNAARVSAKAVSVLGMGRQVEERDRDIVSTPEVGGLSLRTARRKGAWVLFLARVQHVIPREPAKPLLAALGQRFVPQGLRRCNRRESAHGRQTRPYSGLVGA